MLENIYTLTNIIFSYKKRLYNFSFFLKLFTDVKEIIFIKLVDQSFIQSFIHISVQDIYIYLYIYSIDQ